MYLMYPKLCVEYTRLYNSIFKKHLAKNSFYLCNYARVSERSARRDFLSFKKSCTSKCVLYIYLCILLLKWNNKTVDEGDGVNYVVFCWKNAFLMQTIGRYTIFMIKRNSKMKFLNKTSCLSLTYSYLIRTLGVYIKQSRRRMVTIINF